MGLRAFGGSRRLLSGGCWPAGDSLLLMPTGGGKSLCYQLPALAMDGVTLVISPLIALMKDQVDGLNANGIAARFINSTLPVRDVEGVQGEVRQGLVKILYIAPERLAVEGFRRFLSGLKVSLIAIDEAHCISEWGHEFRPDYRNLRQLREMFPRTPLLALTATATERVRVDIVEQLDLKGAEVFVSSFNRANLRYAVRTKDNVERQLHVLLERCRGDAAIIYCFSRQETEDVAAALTARGWRASPYHAGLAPEVRRKAQEDFTRDRVPIIVATIAFGMGVDKPDVRLVVHTSLPKSVESYYQETGRAGRDGLPSECVLLYSYGDKVRQEFFFKRMDDEAERRNAQTKLDQMVRFAQLHTCRRRYLLEYFGERWDMEDCGNCDVCLASEERGEFDATEIAQKALSAVVRTGERYGAAHVAGVLVGSREQRILAAGHDELSVYGIVQRLRPEPASRGAGAAAGPGAAGAERRGVPDAQGYADGRAFLQGRERLSLPGLQETPFDGAQDRLRQAQGERVAPSASAGVSVEYDAGLFEELRALRRRLADAQDVPAFIVFGDVALRHMAGSRPTTMEAFGRVPGVGRAKLEAYGAAFVDAISGYADAHGLAATEELLEATDRPSGGKRASTQDATREMLSRGLSVAAIARERGISHKTVLGHIERLAHRGEPLEVSHLQLAPERMSLVEEAIAQCGGAFLRPLWEYLGSGFSYDEIRIARVCLQQQGRVVGE